MLTDDLYREVLLEPLKRGADTLYIVSGYGAPRLARRHINDASSLSAKGGVRPVTVNLIVGMAAQDKIVRSNHNEFVSLAGDASGGVFRCGYLGEPPPTHAKMYAWFRGKQPVCGHIGSANYTYRGFIAGQREAMTREDPKEILSYYKRMSALAIDCAHPAARRMVRNDERVVAPEIRRARKPRKNAKSVVVSLLTSRGEMHRAGGGLNWGQPSKKRRRGNPNEAYIPLRAAVYHSDFFPPRGEKFIVHTDDGQSFCAARTSDGAKDIHSVPDNSAIGRYFRLRLDSVLGESFALDGMVTKEDLENYGRTDVVFYKIDDENYYMDFSPPSGG